MPDNDTFIDAQPSHHATVALERTAVGSSMIRFEAQDGSVHVLGRAAEPVSISGPPVPL